MQDQNIVAAAAQEAPGAAETLTPKQRAWKAHKAAQRGQRKAGRTLRYVGTGVPRRLRRRVVTIVGWEAHTTRQPAKPVGRTSRGRLSNPTVLRGA